MLKIIQNYKRTIMILFYTSTCLIVTVHDEQHRFIAINKMTETYFSKSCKRQTSYSCFKDLLLSVAIFMCSFLVMLMIMAHSCGVALRWSSAIKQHFCGVKEEHVALIASFSSSWSSGLFFSHRSFDKIPNTACGI